MRPYRTHTAHFGDGEGTHLVCNLCSAVICTQERDHHAEWHEGIAAAIARLAAQLEVSA